MRIDVITLFPQALQQCLSFGVTGRALEQGLAQLKTWNPREFAADERGTVDDRPFGGGPGMVLMAPPLAACIEKVRDETGAAPVGYLSPQGKPLDQAQIVRFSEARQLTLLCGRYEGVDQRLLDTMIDEEWSLGDYVLSGGELAAAVVIDALLRLLPGVLGDADSAVQDSFMEGLLDCPHYTRPETWRGQAVPAVLRSGDHGAVARWRRREALGRTWLRRPDLLEAQVLTEQDQALLEEFVEQYQRREASEQKK